MGTSAGRLKELIERERLNLGIEYKQLAAQAGVASETLRALRSTGKASPLTKRRIEDAVGWAPGSIDAVLAGGDPTRVAPPARNSHAEPSTLEQAQAEIARLRAQRDKEVGELREELLELRAEIERLRNVRNPVAGSG